MISFIIILALVGVVDYLSAPVPDPEDTPSSHGPSAAAPVKKFNVPGAEDKNLNTLLAQRRRSIEKNRDTVRGQG